MDLYIKRCTKINIKEEIIDPYVVIDEKLHFNFFDFSVFMQKRLTQTYLFKNIELPYYNEPTFTPIWLDQSNKKLDQIHRIKSFNFQNQEGKMDQSK